MLLDHCPVRLRHWCTVAKQLVMKLGMQIGLGLGHIVLHRDPAPPIFGPYLLRPNGCSAWIKMALGMELGLSPGDFVLDGDPAPSPKGGQSPLPNFRPISIPAKRLDASRYQLVQT